MSYFGVILLSFIMTISLDMLPPIIAIFLVFQIHIGMPLVITLKEKMEFECHMHIFPEKIKGILIFLLSMGDALITS